MRPVCGCAKASVANPVREEAAHALELLAFHPRRPLGRRGLGARAALSGSGPIADVITKAKNLTSSLDSWAEGGDKRETATKFADLLAAFMYIPEDEVPNVPSSGIPVPVR